MYELTPSYELIDLLLQNILADNKSECKVIMKVLHGNLPNGINNYEECTDYTSLLHDVLVNEVKTEFIKELIEYLKELDETFKTV